MNLSEEEYSQCGEYLLCFVLCKPLVFVDKADINTLIDQRKLQKIESLKIHASKNASCLAGLNFIDQTCKEKKSGLHATLS